MEASKPKSKIERLIENLTGTTEHTYHSRVKSPNFAKDKSYLSDKDQSSPMPVLPRHQQSFVNDKSYLNDKDQSSPMPVLPRHQTLEEYNNARLASQSANSKNFRNFV